MAALAVACAMVSCTKPNDDPKPGPDEKAPVANFTFSANALTVSFTNTSENATSYKWEFGDGETSKEASPKHEYASAGTYTVKLTAANASGVTAKKEASVTVAGAAKAYFSYEAVEGRPGKFGLILKFDATASANAESIEWNFGDGTTDNQFTVNHEFPEYGKYTVSATVKGLGGDSDTFSQEVECIASNNILLGGEFNEGDEAHWIIKDLFISDMDYETPIEKLCWEPTFGYKEVTPSAGKGGCLLLDSKNQNHDWANNYMMLQAIQVEVGDSLYINLDMKWNENTNNNGLLRVGFVDDPATPSESALFNYDVYNYWPAVPNSKWNEDWTEIITPADPSVPAYDGNLGGTDDLRAAATELGFDTNIWAENPHPGFRVKESGTIYFYIELRSVWGEQWGPGRFYYFDNAEVRVIL